QHDIVLILAEKVKTFGSEHANDSEGYVADAERLAERILVGEQLVGNGFADDRRLGDAAHFLVGEHHAAANFPIANLRIIRPFTLDEGVPIEAVCEPLRAIAHLRTYSHYVG